MRAVSEFHLKMENIQGNIAIIYDSLENAYRDCRRNKASSANAIAYEMFYEANLFRLRDEINARSYTPQESIAFIVNKPVQREIFAANFRDRVVHHWIALRIEPLLEKIFIGESFNCRKEKGTLAGIVYLRDAIRQKSENYTRDCWVLKYDLKGFFMSISRERVTDKLCRFIEEKYTGDDKDTLIFLCRQILLNAPEKNCKIKGSWSEWNGLPADKSLFTVPDGFGLPIGNLTSQLVANFLLNDADHYCKEVLGLDIDRYVDDTASVDTDKDKMLAAMPLIRQYLWESAGAVIHPHKFYLQHYTKGVKFIGCVVKKERLYLANRTVGNAYKRLHKFNELAAADPNFPRKHAEYFVSCINSYLGLMRHCNAYGLRRDFIAAIGKEWHKVVTISPDYTKLIVKPKFKQRERIRYVLRRQRNKTISTKIQNKQMTARDFSTADKAVAVEQLNFNRKKGCVVRWDFEPVKNKIPLKPANKPKRGKGKPAPETAQPQVEGQDYKETVSNLVAFSVKSYPVLPTADEVVADIEADLTARYPDGNRPAIDFAAYREAINNLHTS